MALPMKVEPGQDTRVRVEYQGKRYVISIGLHVFGIEPGVGKDPLGNPQFNVQLAPVMAVAEDKQ
jgi:hypothetical protein